MVMTGQSDEQILREHFQRFPQIGFVLDPSAFLLLLGTLQFALRHPQFGRGASGQKIRTIVDNLIKRVSDGDAYVKSLLQRGDDPAHDVAVDAAQQAAPKGGPEFAAEVEATLKARRVMLAAAEKALAFLCNITTFDPRAVATELGEALQLCGREVDMASITSSHLVAPVWACEEIRSLYDCYP